METAFFISALTFDKKLTRWKIGFFYKQIY